MRRDVLQDAVILAAPAGAGPVGLAAAIDLAHSGLAVVLDNDDNVSRGSRRLPCQADTEVPDRLGVGNDCL